MLLRLGKDATSVRIYKSRAAHYMTVEVKGRNRKLFQTETTKLVEFPVYESAEAHMANIANENGEPEFSAEDIEKAEAWIESQMQEIDAAYRLNQSLGLMGGVPVIKRASSDDQKYCSAPGFVSGRKVGEFIGVIRGAHDYKPKMRKKINLPEIEVDEDKSLAKAWEDGRIEDLCDEMIDLIAKTAGERGKPIDEAFTEEEIRGFYVASKKVFFLTTIYMGVNQAVIEHPIKDKLAEIKKEMGRYKQKKPRRRKPKQPLA